MKKFLSLILALAMVACMSVTAFAADTDYPGGTTTLSTTVPNTPAYTLNIPANQTIKFGDVETKIGSVSVSDVDSTFRYISCYATWTDFTDGTNSIPLELVTDEYLNGTLTGTAHRSLGDGTMSNSVCLLAPSVTDLEKTYSDIFVLIEDTAWAAAVPGDYSATITWTTEGIK